MTQRRAAWFRAEEGKVHETVFEYVSTVEGNQSDLFERFVKLEALYDPNGQAAEGTDIRADMIGVVENAIARNIDTVTAVVAMTDVRSRFQTDGADWFQQRQAKLLEWYVEGVAKQVKRKHRAKLSFKGGAKKGTGLVKIYPDEIHGEVRCEHVLVDDIVVDRRECRHGGAPRQLHQRRIVDRDELIAEYPEHEEQIERAQGGGGTWAGYRPLEENEVVVLESWRLPYGKPPGDDEEDDDPAHYIAGRHTITIENCDLFDEEWHEPFFPFAIFRWEERDNDFYGISLAERIAGHQRALNRRNLHIERANDQVAFPTTYVRQADANLAVKGTNRIGTVAIYKSDLPVTITPPAVSPEIYKSREDLNASADEESGVSRMASRGVKPPGLDSGAALRELRDATTQRFATQETGYEELNLECDMLIVWACKKLGDRAPVIDKSSRYGERALKWSDVDMGDVRVQISAASMLPRTSAGRMQLALEWAQAGIISTDSARRLSGHQDLEKELSLYTAALEAVEESLWEIELGGVVMPEPFDNLAMIKWRGQQRYLELRTLKGVPEEVLEAVRQYVVQAAYLLDLQDPAAATNDNAAAGMADPMAADPSAIDPAMMQGGAPTGQPTAALAPEAMNLMAS